MRNILITGVSAIALAGYLLIISQPISLSSGSIPPLGNFLNPFSGFWQNAENVKVNAQFFEIPSTYNAEIALDERAVPHIFTETENARLFAQGYMHAKDRLWQMDISSRQAAGRLSEVLGSRLLANDRRMRLLGMNHAAKIYAESWISCPDYPLLQSYVDGVNAYIASLNPSDYPLEFKLLNYVPEKWSVQKSALVMMNMNLVLCSRNEDIEATNSLAHFGLDTFNYLFPRWNPKQSPIIPKDHQWEFDHQPSDTSINVKGPFLHQIVQEAPESVGSNNWAVSSSKTINGSPILCNDPHLSLSLPSIWYEMHMVSDIVNVYGVSIPGLPHIAIGFNENIAWGETNVGMDVLDYYEISWVDASKKSYWLDQKKVNIEERIETFHVRDSGLISDTLKISRWGAIRTEGDRSLAVQWLPNLATENCIIQTFYNLNRAQNFEDYYNALGSFSSPAQNFAFASKDGDIALKVQGQLPIRTSGEGQFVYDGSTAANDWEGYIPFGHTPFVKNPKRGFISSANQHSTDTTYPYNYHGHFADFRGRTINNILAEEQDISVEFMQKMQFNSFDLSAAELCPALLTFLEETDPGSTYNKKLSEWDYHYESQEEAPVIWEVWKTHFTNSISKNIKEQESNLLDIELWRIIDLTINDPASFIFNDRNNNEINTANDLARLAWSHAVNDLDSILEEGGKLSWESYRPMSINHLTRIPAFSALDIKTGGTSTAINATKSSFGPSWRMIVELSTPVKAWGVYPGGQSGNPGSKYYKNMIQKWAAGDYYPLHFSSSLSQMNTDFPTIINLKS